MLSRELHAVSILPELVLSVAGIIVMLVDPFMDARKSRRPLGIIAFVGAVAALAASFYQIGYQGTSYFNVVRVDTFSVFFHVVVIAISGVAILASLDYLDKEGIRAGEYYALILFGTVGMCLLSSAIELLMLFIALEISSISTYILAGFRRRI